MGLEWDQGTVESRSTSVAKGVENLARDDWCWNRMLPVMHHVGLVYIDDTGGSVNEWRSSGARPEG